MRILVLNYEYPPLGGGAAPVAKEITHGLAELGHTIDVVTMGYGDLPALVDESENIRVHRVPALRKHPERCSTLEMLSYVLSAKRYLKIMLQQGLQFDVCHCHFLIPTGILLPWLKRKWNIPALVTIHGSDIPGYNPDRFQLQHKITPPLLRYIARNTKRVVSPSHYLSQQARSILKNTDISYIPNGFHADLLTPKRKEKIIVSTGRLLRRKGFHTLIGALQDVETDWEIHICGDGPMMAELRRLAEKSRTSVVFHGWLDSSGDEYRQLLSTASIYALVSERENASISLLEAMNAGCAVITSNTTGCAETIGNAGVTVTPGDTDRLQAELQHLMDNPTEREVFGRKAAARVGNKYNWNRIIGEYEQELLQLNSKPEK